MSAACFVDTFALPAMLNPADTRRREAMAFPPTAGRNPRQMT